jgi:hypothetical protein
VSVNVASVTGRTPTPINQKFTRKGKRLKARIDRQGGDRVVRFALSCGVLAATSALCACSSPSVPSWAVAGQKGHYLVEKRMTQRSPQKAVYVAPTVARPRINREEPYSDGLPSKPDYFEPGSEEWRHAQEIEQQKFDSLLAICRSC